MVTHTRDFGTEEDLPDGMIGFECCPQCGEMCMTAEIRDDYGRLQYIRADCRCCGELRLVYDAGLGYWKIDGTGIPYICALDSNEPALYERFDLSSYEDVREGLSAKFEMLKKFIDNTADTPRLFERYNRDMLDCAASMRALGMDDGGWTLRATCSIMEFSTKEEAERLSESVSSEAVSADDSVLCDIAGRLVKAEYVHNTTFAVTDRILDEVYGRIMSFKAEDGDDLLILDDMFLTLERSSHPGISKAARRIAESVMEMDDDEKYRGLSLLFSDICESVDDADVVGMMLAAVREFDDDTSDCYFEILLRYAELMMDRPNTDGHLYSLLKEGVIEMEEYNCDFMRVNRVVFRRSWDHRPFSGYIAMASMYLDMLHPEEEVHLKRAMREVLSDRSMNERLAFPVIRYCLTSESLSKRKKDSFRVKAMKLFPGYAEYDEMCRIADETVLPCSG